MKKYGRKEVKISFKGVATDGGIIFKVAIFLPNAEHNWIETAFKAMTYEKGVIKIAIDYKENIPRVAQIIVGIFSKKSNFANLDSVILEYRNICLQIEKSNARKDIICMIMKEMSMPGYKEQDNDISVDTGICQKCIPLRDSDKQNIKYEEYTNSFRLDEEFEKGKNLGFMTPNIRESIIISSVKDGIVTVESKVTDFVSDFVAELRKFFIPYSNFYGIKALEVEFNQFSIRVDEHNVDDILYLYKRSCDMSFVLRDKEFESEIKEDYNSLEYIRNRAKILKSDNRKNVVIQKIRQMQKKGTDFTIVNKKKQKEWEDFKDILQKGNFFSNLTIEYTVLWAQYMEYLINKHNKKLSDILDWSYKLANKYLVKEQTYGYIILILSKYWKYGEELRVKHNQKYNYEGDGVLVRQN